MVVCPRTNSLPLCPGRSIFKARIALLFVSQDHDFFSQMYQVEPALTVEEPPELKSSVEEVPEPATPPKPESDPVVVAVTTPPAAPDSTPVPTTTVHSEALHKPSSAKPPLSPGSGSSAAAISEQKEEAIPADPASPAWRETASSTPTPNNSLKEVMQTSIPAHWLFSR